MDLKLSLDTMLIVLVAIVFIVDWRSENRTRGFIKELRREQRDEIVDLRSKNRKLRRKLQQVCQDLKQAEQRVKRLERKK
ncbi:MAG: hypothetical protein OXG60_13465 [Chloroflexi bacterium]|nr:hypothetical protein [Chloroflexota bacterium]